MHTKYSFKNRIFCKWIIKNPWKSQFYFVQNRFRNKSFTLATPLITCLTLWKICLILYFRKRSVYNMKSQMALQMKLFWGSITFSLDTFLYSNKLMGWIFLYTPHLHCIAIFSDFAGAVYRILTYLNIKLPGIGFGCNLST